MQKNENELIKIAHDGECPDCATPISDNIENGDPCPECGHIFYAETENVA